MKRIAAPLIGGLITSFLLELVVYPAVYQIWRWNFDVNRHLAPQSVTALHAGEEIPSQSERGTYALTLDLIQKLVLTES